MTDIIEKWTVDELSKGLVGQLSSELVQTLKDQKINGSYFLKLTDSTLKLFNFDLVDIIDIVSLIKDVKDGTKVLSIEDPTVEIGDENKENEGSTSYETEFSEADSILREFLKADYVESLSPYELKGLYSRCRNWKHLQNCGLPGSSRPNLSVPATAWISVESNNQSSCKRKRTEESGPARKSGRLMKPVENVIFVPSEDFSEDEKEDDLDLNILDPSLKYKLPETLNVLTAEELAASKPHLPKYDVEKILMDAECAKPFVSDLKNGFVFDGKYRKMLFRVVMRYLCHTYVDHPVKVTTSMREGLAKSFIVAFPQFQKVVTVPKQTPWSHLVGHFGNIYKRIMTKLPVSERPRKGKASQKKTTKIPVAGCTVDVSVLAIINADRAHRDEIIGGMRDTFSLRVAERMKGSSITELIQKYPHFTSYSGELLTLEFELMHPKAVDMCRIMTPLVEKVLKNFNDPRIKPSCDNAGLKAFLLLASKLPRTIDKRSPPFPNEEEILVILKLGVDVEESVEKRRKAASQSVQPYLIGITGIISKEVLKYFLVLDSNIMELGRVPFLRAADWLFKAYWVFNVHYPNSWKSFFKFLQTCVYQVFLDSSDVSPSAQALYSRLLSLP